MVVGLLKRQLTTLSQTAALSPDGWSKRTGGKAWGSPAHPRAPLQQRGSPRRPCSSLEAAP